MIKKIFSIALHLAANMMVSRVNEAVESTSKQNIRGIYISKRSPQFLPKANENLM
jgi:hypothetical protein